MIKRILALISRSAQLIADSIAAKSQAESATRTAELLLENSSTSKSSEETKDKAATNNEDLVKCLKLKDDEISSLNQSLKKAQLDLEVMKKQSESVSREYDNLLKEHDKLSRSEKNSESKKDN